MLAITGMQATKVLGTAFQQEVYLELLRGQPRKAAIASSLFSDKLKQLR